MLVLSRNDGERTLLFKDGELLGVIQIIDVIGSKVKVGFDLPEDIQIIREEVLENKR